MISFNFDKYRQLNKFQVGGQVATKSKQSAEDQQEKAMVYATLGMIGYAASQQKQMDFATAVAEVMQYGQSPEGMKQLQQIAGNKELVKTGMEIMKQKEPEMLQQISQPGGFKQILAQIEQQKNQQQTTMAKQGAKLEYINRLKGVCPEGYEMSYMKAGGKACPVCKKKVKINKDCGGVKMKMHATGGISEIMNQIKTDLLTCGGKMKKVKKDGEGGPVDAKKRPTTYTKEDEQKHKILLKKMNKKGLKSLSPQQQDSIAIYNKFYSQKYANED